MDRRRRNGRRKGGFLSWLIGLVRMMIFLIVLVMVLKHEVVYSRLPYTARILVDDVDILLRQTEDFFPDFAEAVEGMISRIPFFSDYFDKADWGENGPPRRPSDNEKETKQSGEGFPAHDSGYSFSDGVAGESTPETAYSGQETDDGFSLSGIDFNYGDTGYCYSLLDSSDEQRMYMEILEGLRNVEEFPVSTPSTEMLEKVYFHLLADHPEIFYVSGYASTVQTMNGLPISLKVSPDYSMSREDVEKYKSSVEDIAREILVGAPGNGTDYDFVKYIFDYLIRTTEYELGADQNQNILSVLIKGRSVCNGYSKTMQYLLGLGGIESVTVSGVADGELHAWNVVKMDGAYYQFDVTWGDALSSGEDGYGDYVNYAYFALTSEEMERDHQPDDTFRIPSCTAAEGNYFIKNGLFVEGEDMEKLARIFTRAHSAGQSFIQFRCSSSGVREWCLSELVSEGKLGQLLPGLTEYRYAVQEAQNVLCFFMD